MIDGSLPLDLTYLTGISQPKDWEYGVMSWIDIGLMNSGKPGVNRKGKKGRITLSSMESPWFPMA